jgi:hypothetical protein
MRGGIVRWGYSDADENWNSCGSRRRHACLARRRRALQLCSRSSTLTPTHWSAASPFRLSPAALMLACCFPTAGSRRRTSRRFPGPSIRPPTPWSRSISKHCKATTPARAANRVVRTRPRVSHPRWRNRVALAAAYLAAWTGAVRVSDRRTSHLSHSQSRTLAVPELSTWAMMLVGFVGLGLAGRRSMSQAAGQTDGSHFVIPAQAGI